MDLDRFDALTRVVMTTGARRSMLRGLTSAVLGGALGWAGVERADARKKKNKKKKRKNKKKKNQTSSPLPPPEPTCSDGIQNGSETSIDCGGTCPRCANSQGCVTRDDCAGALCSGGTCQACSVDSDCGRDFRSVCYCRTSTAGSKFCATDDANGPFTSCASCLSDEICYPSSSGTFVGCVNGTLLTT